MALPGKLCIGIIEEDNPQKSYFRFKPLLIAEGEKYVPYDEFADYPENGCIRIVPDKNESSRFKARMRRMGLYAMVDLREHPDENDKIRPNKNYHGDESEPNAYIIYSDVVRELPEGVICEIVPQDVPGDSAQLALTLDTPSTPRVIFSGFEPFGATWTHSPISGTDDGIAFVRTHDSIDEGIYARHTLPCFGGKTIDVAVANPGKLLYALAAPEAQPAPVPAQPAAPANTAPAAAPLQPQEAPQSEQPAPAPASAAWICHDESILPPPIDPRLSPREQAIAMQTGLNPRRGRSLQEIIEDKWRRSRIDQLGHPVPGSATGNPVMSPVDSAIEAVSVAWNYENARAVLAGALAGIEGLNSAIAVSADKAAAEAIEARKAEYAAEQENLNAEIERCRNEREKLQGEMLRELEERHTAELEEHAKHVKQLEEAEEALKGRADEARLIAAEAERAIAQLTDEKLTQRLSEYAVGSRAADILAALGRGEIKSGVVPEVNPVCCANVAGLVKRVRSHFCANGHHLTDNEAINLLACVALGDKVILTGPAGCGKTSTARLLTEALGLMAAGRCADYVPAVDGHYAAPFSGSISQFPAAVIADDINAAGMCSERLVSDFEPLNDIKLIMTAQDSTSGKPMGLRLMDRAFVIRLEADSADSAWSGPGKKTAPPEGCVTAEALTMLFCPDARHISTQVSAKLAALRKELAEYNVLISRRTLDAIWQYCASVTPYMSLTPMEVFDLAFAQRALPAIIASGSPEALHALPNLLAELPRSLALLKQPLAIEV